MVEDMILLTTKNLKHYINENVKTVRGMELLYFQFRGINLDDKKNYTNQTQGGPDMLDSPN